MRNRIMAAAAEEMRIRSIKFTMSDLARRLGVSKRRLYEHFESKDDIIYALVDDHLEKIHERRQAILQDDSLNYRQKLAGMFVAEEVSLLPPEGRIANDFKRFMPLVWQKFEQFCEMEWGLVEQLMRDGIEARELRPVHLPVLKRLMDSVRRDVIEYGFLLQNNISLLQAINCVMDIVQYGIVAREEWEEGHAAAEESELYMKHA